MSYRLGKKMIKEQLLKELNKSSHLVSNLVELLPENMRVSRQTASIYLMEMAIEGKVEYTEVLTEKGREVKLWKPTKIQ